MARLILIDDSPIVLKVLQHELAERGHTVQMWTRLGYGRAIGPAPRRGLEAHVRKA